MTTLKTGMWDGERCFVVGGGPSLRGFDWSRLDGERVIAVNRAYEVLPRAIVCSMDLTFWRLKGKYIEMLNHCRQSPTGGVAPIVPAVHVRVGGEKLPAAGPSQIVPCCVGDVPNPHLVAAWGSSLEGGLGCGGNSGFTAVNLADVLGARTIYLLGFDMRGEGEGLLGLQAWWHDGYPPPQQRAAPIERRVRYSVITSVARSNSRKALLRTVETPYPTRL